MTRGILRGHQLGGLGSFEAAGAASGSPSEAVLGLLLGAMAELSRQS